MLNRNRLSRQLVPEPPEGPRGRGPSHGVLNKCFKHTDLGAGCAVSANAALEKTRENIGIQAVDGLDKLDDTNEKLVEFIEKSGAWPAEENGIKTVRSLLDIMLITGAQPCYTECNTQCYTRCVV